jgi:ABC transport system ATP-binding/permease protein
MHYVSAEGLYKSYGINPLFENLSFNINEGDKISLIARNGSGKSTLLKILAGKETADSGNLWIHKDVDVVLFEQEPVFIEDKTVSENIFFHNHPVIQATRNYEAACIGGGEQELTAAISKMDELGAWDFDAKVKQVLSRLNITQLNQPPAKKSCTGPGADRHRVRT